MSHCVRPMHRRAMIVCDVVVGPTLCKLLHFSSSSVLVNQSSSHSQFHTRQSALFINVINRNTCRSSSTIVESNEQDTDDLQQDSRHDIDELKVIPKVESHHVMVTNDLIDIARHNSVTVQKYRLKVSTKPDFLTKYRGEALTDHEEQMDDEDEGEENDVNKLEHDGVPPPLITYEGKETYFQFDYRNHKTEVNAPMKNLLEKIETTLYNTHLEPYEKFRGVATMKQNIELMEEGVKFRLGRRRSMTKDGGVMAIRKHPENVTGYIQLKRALLRLLKDRHSIYTSGNTNTITELKWKKIGQGFFGPDSDVCVKYNQAERMLRDLWFRGTSDIFNKLQKWHFRLVEKKKQRLLHPRDPDEPVTPKAVKKK